jgi:hypothetical protein
VIGLERRVENAELATADQSRFVPLALQLRRKSNGEPLLMAGGQFDRLTARFTDAPVAPHVLPIEESQLEFFRWWSMWLASFRDGTPREISFAMCAGNRRAGKSHGTLLAQVSACVEVPGTIAWCVVDSFRSRDEVDRTITENVPGEWFHRRLSPEFAYTFANGSIIRILSADDSEALKAGRVDVANLVDLQKLSAAALLNTLGGTIDRNGIVLASANPPRKARGQFVIDLKERLEVKQLAGSLFFGFDANLNTAVDQGARARFAAIAEVVDPKLGDADAEGTWRPIEDMACPRFTAANVGAIPEQLDDITQRLIAAKVDRSFPYFAGADFQKYPWHAVTFLRAFRRADGKALYVAVGEVVHEGTETELLDRIDDVGTFTPENTVCVLDASAWWQDGAHTRGRSSSDIFKSRRWPVYPPQSKRSEKGEHARNPAVEDRLSLLNNLLTQERLLIDPTHCPKLALALKKCELKFGKPRGRYAHQVDSLSYALWWIEPKTAAPSEPHSINVETFNALAAIRLFGGGQ